MEILEFGGCPSSLSQLANALPRNSSSLSGEVNDQMGRFRSLARILTALVVCAGLLPAGSFLRWAVDAQPACALHGDACTCATKCKRHQHDSEATLDSSSDLACHRKAGKASPAASSENRRTTSQWASCGEARDNLAAPSDRPYLQAAAAPALHLPDEQPLPSSPPGSWIDPGYMPLTPPPKA